MPVTNAEPPASMPAVQNTVVQQGPNNTNIENATNVNVNPITYNIGVGSTDCRTILLNPSYCNLFIIKDESFNGNCFTLRKERVLKRNITEEINRMFASLSDDAKNEIMRFPSLFMDTNKDYRRCTNPLQEFYYGLVTNITEQGKNIKIHFTKMLMQPMYQQKLNEASVVLGINSGNGKDVLDETGWIIKKINLQQAFTNAGIEYTLY
jgi:hypothetical protein